MNPLNLICHREKNRTLKYKSYYFPVCARCTGLYISYISFIILTSFFEFQYNVFMILTSFLLLIPGKIDGLTQLLGLRESNNYLRLITGLLGGIGLAILMKILFFYFQNTL